MSVAEMDGSCVVFNTSLAAMQFKFSVRVVKNL